MLSRIKKSLKMVAFIYYKYIVRTFLKWISMNKNYLIDLPDCEKSVYSQHEQDGILEKLFSHLPTENSPPFCVEFGFSSTSLTGNSNSANLILNHGWQSVLLDGGNENLEINLHKSFITSKNICNLLKKHNVPKNLEYLSVDIDSTDIWILMSILEVYRPLVITIEYNSQFPFNQAITFPDDPEEFWEEDSVYGCSVGAIKLLAEHHNYKIVYVGGTDVYLVSAHAIPRLKPLPLNYFSIVQKRAPLRVHKPCTTGREKIMLDYSVWLKTNSVEKARKAAEPASVQYLT
jgi:hypothetical protein